MVRRATTMLLPSLLLLLAALPALTAAQEDGEPADDDPNKSQITVYVVFDTYNGDDITAWEILEFDARLNENSTFDYQDFLEATVQLTWMEKIDDAAEAEREVGKESMSSALRLVGNPEIIFGLDVDCPDPPGWVPPVPRDGYTCQEFRTALRIEVDKSKLDGGDDKSPIAEIEMEMAVGAHVQHVYRNAIHDGTMEAKLRFIEGGGGDMRILWDDPSLREAWARYGGDDLTVPGAGNWAGSTRDNGDGNGGGPSKAAIAMIVLIASVVFVFLLCLCISGEMNKEAARAESSDEFPNEGRQEQGEQGQQQEQEEEPKLEGGERVASSSRSNLVPPSKALSALKEEKEENGGNGNGDGNNTHLRTESFEDVIMKSYSEEDDVELPPIT